jgi:RimJ/RimL family protein N-acetyltransferase
MEIPTLQTDRLLLRPFRTEDFEAYAAMNALDEVMRHIDKAQDREQSFRSLAANIGHWTLRGYGPWAVEERETGAFIGRVGLLRWNDWPSIEVGYALIPSRWGKGYAVEAAERARRYGHEVVGARGLVSMITPDNAPSIRVAERMGARFQCETTSRGKVLHVYVHPDP